MKLGEHSYNNGVSARRQKPGIIPLKEFGLQFAPLYSIAENNLVAFSNRDKLNDLKLGSGVEQGGLNG